MSDVTPLNQPEDDKNSSLSLNEPKSKVQGIFQSLEMMVHQRGKSGFDVSSFSPEQKDKLLDMLASNEANAFSYHTKKLDVTKELTLAHINSTTVTQRTNRYIGISVVAVLSIITVVILLFKDTYFVHWLTFITGLLGGFGIGRFAKDSSKSEKVEKITIDDDNE